AARATSASCFSHPVEATLVHHCAHGRTQHLLERGVEVGEIRHKMPIGAWDGGLAPGVDPARGDYASFADFSDPDGNRWVLQERGYRGDVGSGAEPRGADTP